MRTPLKDFMDDLFPGLTEEIKVKIEKVYGGAIADIIKEFVSAQFEYIDNLKPIDEQRCFLCKRSAKETWFVSLNDKNVCNRCVLEGMESVKYALTSADIDTIQGNTGPLRECRENFKNEIECFIGKTNKEGDSEIEEVKIKQRVEVTVQDEKYWANLGELDRLFSELASTDCLHVGKDLINHLLVSVQIKHEKQAGK